MRGRRAPPGDGWAIAAGAFIAYAVLLSSEAVRAAPAPRAAACACGEARP